MDVWYLFIYLFIYALIYCLIYWTVFVVLDEPRMANADAKLGYTVYLSRTYIVRVDEGTSM